MRNVTIWAKYEDDGMLVDMVRLYEFKGRRQTLNEFLLPLYVSTDQLTIALAASKLELNTIKPLKKGDTLAFVYNSMLDVERNEGRPKFVSDRLPEAINQLIKAGYEFFGDEKRNQRVRVHGVDQEARQKEYVRIARDYEVHGFLQHTLKEIKAEHPAAVMTESEFREKGLDLSDMKLPDYDAAKLVVSPAVVQAPARLELVSPIKTVVAPEPNPDAETVSQPPVPPTPPAPRVLNDLDVPVKHNSDIPVPKAKTITQGRKKPTFMENMMKFLRLFKK